MSAKRTSSASYGNLLRCTLCGKILLRMPVYLELDQRDGTYHDFKDVPESKSQGCFPFGFDCADAKRFEARAAREAAAKAAQ